LLREDPEGVEIKELERSISFKGNDVLEVGCGNGRLTFQYAGETNKVMAIDPSTRAISEARKNTPKELGSKIGFRVGRGESLKFPNETFDIVFFAWSLCCADGPAMGKAMDEAWRVLRRKGILVNIQASLHQPLTRGTVSYLIERNSGPADWSIGDRQARSALRHSAFVEQKFDLVSEKEFPVFSYYGSTREALRNIAGQSGVDYEELNRETKRRVREILDSLKTKQGIRTQENAVLTILRKSSVNS
jgi:ubiquinone/menaquinone biosynthesis C-methylase UbiE